MQAVPRKGAYAPFSAALYAQQTAGRFVKKHYFLTVSKSPAGFPVGLWDIWV